MYEREIRWLALIPLAALTGILSLGLEMTGVWPDFLSRPDWFWILAFCATLHAYPVSSLFAIALCGVARDFLIGPKTGSAALAFVLVGWLVQFWKPTIRLHGAVGQAVAAGISAFFVAVVKHALDWYGMATALWLDNIMLSAGDAALTVVAYIPVVVILSLPGIRPWREQKKIFI